MGNSFGCVGGNQQTKRGSRKLPEAPYLTASASRRTGKVYSSSLKKESLDDDSVIRQKAVAAALLYQHHQQMNGDLPQLDRSVSVQYPLPSSSKKQNKLPRSSSSRPRSVSHLQKMETKSERIHQTENMKRNTDLIGSKEGCRPTDSSDLKLEDLESKHFVLVHGGGFGAWCWYKSIALLEETGFEADAVDLTGCGINSYDANNITSLAQYTKPLVDFLEKLEDGKKVILVGHDIGGTCVSYVMELFPSKVSKAIFIAATMPTSGQSTLDTFSQQTSSNDLMQQAQIFSYAKGKDHAPTAFSLDKALLRDLLFNQSPAKDVALASVSMRPIPFAPVTEKLFLSHANFGSIPRFYIKTEEDFAISLSHQEAMIKSSPPQRVLQLKGSDHSPFFSRPQALHRLLVELSTVPSKQF
ncbi:hypothetical protein RJ639_027141 [Escallonia herrerae]|uniref:AB hydrolase-1 domain-containing protein n=1 Tax=Escallonia herrerae TaxID=1293975 RepID=A0AA88X4L2_9ASTE|nr:hypothetical protein RJ639_027141 [Escallonia herrerae]